MVMTDEHQTAVSEPPAIAGPLEAIPAGQSRLSTVSGGAVVTEHAELIEKIRDSLSKFQMDFQAKRPIADEILRDSQAKYDEIMGMLSNQLHQAQIERAKLEAEIAQLRNDIKSDMVEKKQAAAQLAAIQSDKSAIEAELKKAVADAQVLGREVTSLKSELDKAKDLVEAAVVGKKEIEKKLTQMQEQWDKYIAGN